MAFQIALKNSGFPKNSQVTVPRGIFCERTTRCSQPNLSSRKLLSLTSTGLLFSMKSLASCQSGEILVKSSQHAHYNPPAAHRALLFTLLTCLRPSTRPYRCKWESQAAFTPVSMSTCPDPCLNLADKVPIYHLNIPSSSQRDRCCSYPQTTSNSQNVSDGTTTSMYSGVRR